MSYDVTLVEEVNYNGVHEEWVCRSVNTIEDGGTYPIGGTDECTLNVTYNYSKVYREVADFSLQDLDGRVARNFIPVMERIVERCGTERNADYWLATYGNAGHAINILLGWAREHPDARWSVS